jgi:hypothetical protein
MIHATGKSAERTRSEASGLLGKEDFGADIVRPFCIMVIILLFRLCVLPVFIQDKGIQNKKLAANQ